jgi:hypothetical protein
VSDFIPSSLKGRFEVRKYLALLIPQQSGYILHGHEVWFDRYRKLRELLHQSPLRVFFIPLLVG